MTAQENSLIVIMDTKLRLSDQLDRQIIKIVENEFTEKAKTNNCNIWDMISMRFEHQFPNAVTVKNLIEVLMGWITQDLVNVIVLGRIKQIIHVDDHIKMQEMIDNSQNLQDRIITAVQIKKKRRIQMCAMCKNHKINSRWKGHKHYCRFQNCKCRKCDLIRDRSQQNKLRYNQNKEGGRTLETAEEYETNANQTAMQGNYQMTVNPIDQELKKDFQMRSLYLEPLQPYCHNSQPGYGYLNDINRNDTLPISKQSLTEMMVQSMQGENPQYMLCPLNSQNSLTNYDIDQNAFNDAFPPSTVNTQKTTLQDNYKKTEILSVSSNPVNEEMTSLDFKQGEPYHQCSQPGYPYLNNTSASRSLPRSTRSLTEMQGENSEYMLNPRCLKYEYNEPESEPLHSNMNM